MILYIKNKNKLYAVVIRSNYSSDGIIFFTPDDYSQQLGYMKRPLGYNIQPHVHNAVSRQVNYTKEAEGLCDCDWGAIFGSRVYSNDM